MVPRSDRAPHLLRCVPVSLLSVIRTLRVLPWVVALAMATGLVGPGLGTAAAEPATWVVHTRTAGDAEAVARDVGAAPDETYQAVGGFTARLTPGQLGAVRVHPGVLGLEPDRTVAPLEPRPSRLSAEALQTGQTGNWGLDRIDQRF